MTLVFRDVCLVDGTGSPPRPGALAVEQGRITEIADDLPAGDTVIDGRGRVLTPGFVDAHTHLCWAGDRKEEWAAMVAGTPYLELLKAGGGIHSTVRATRAATREQLADLLRHRLAVALRQGTTTIEVKSGYGLLPEHELKQLHAIADAATTTPMTVVPTALLGHALDPAMPDPVASMTGLLPTIREAFGPIAVDAYVEEGAWSVEQGVALFRAARDGGHPVRVHLDQFHALGMLEEAIALGAASVDHLEASTPEGLAKLGASDTVGVVLPISGLHTDGRYADARAILDAGGRVVVATNANPGSAPSTSMPLAIALAVRKCGLTPMEAIVASTSEPARLLGLKDRGVLAVGARADVVMLRHTDWRGLAWELGGDPVDGVWVGGECER